MRKYYEVLKMKKILKWLLIGFGILVVIGVFASPSTENQNNSVNSGNTITNSTTTEPVTSETTTETTTVESTTEESTTEEETTTKKAETTTKKETTTRKETTTKKVTTTKKETTTKVATNSNVSVWIPESGKKYHSKSSCSGMKNPSKVTKQEAIDLGYGPCSKCY